MPDPEQFARLGELRNSVGEGIAYNAVSVLAVLTDATALAWGTFAVTATRASAALVKAWWDGRTKSLARDLELANKQIRSLEAEIAAMKADHAREIADMRSEHASEVADLRGQVERLLAHVGVAPLKPAVPTEAP